VRTWPIIGDHRQLVHRRRWPICDARPALYSEQPPYDPRRTLADFDAHAAQRGIELRSIGIGRQLHAERAEALVERCRRVVADPRDAPVVEIQGRQ
jgi:hypothetical protein